MRALFSTLAVAACAVLLAAPRALHESENWPEKAVRIGVVAVIAITCALLAIAHRPDPDPSRRR